MDGAEVALAALGIMSAIVAALIWLLKKLFTQNDKVLAKLTDTLGSLDDTLKKNNDDQASNNATMVTLIRSVIEMVTSIDKKADRNYEATISVQTVENQTVQHQTVTKG